MRNYIQNTNTSEKYLIDEKINGGIVVGTFCEETGIPQGSLYNDYSTKYFIPEEELSQWAPYNFKPAQDRDSVVSQVIVDLARALVTKILSEGEYWPELESYQDEIDEVYNHANLYYEVLFGEEIDKLILKLKKEKGLEEPLTKYAIRLEVRRLLSGKITDTARELFNEEIADEVAHNSGDSEEPLMFIWEMRDTFLSSVSKLEDLKKGE